MSTTAKAFKGSWRIVEMATWNQDAVELLGPGFLRFEGGSLGEFRFCTVQGGLDCRYGRRARQPAVDFSWSGVSDADDASGRGWAVIEADGTMSGKFFMHGSDDSAFKATRGVVARLEKARRLRRPRR